MSDFASFFSGRSSTDPRPRRNALLHEEAPYGFEILAAGKDPNVDIFAIHGRDGHRETSWTAKNGVLWLKDLLPYKIPNARIITYGYDSDTHGKEQLTNQFLHDHAMTFICHLELFRKETLTEDRPIIFIVHDLGGILLKSALIQLKLSTTEFAPDRVAIASSVHGIFFIGTPHQGVESAEFGRVALNTRSFFSPGSDALLRLLRKDSETIQHQLLQFAAISGKFEIKYFYEMYPTEVADGIKVLIVPKSSAVIPSAANCEAGLYKDHENLVRFGSVNDPDYRFLSSQLLASARAAAQQVKSPAKLK